MARVPVIPWTIRTRRAHEEIIGGDEQGRGNPINREVQARPTLASEPWPRNLDAYLREISGSHRDWERDAIISIRISHITLSKEQIWSRILRLGLTNRKRAPYRTHDWSAEEDEILRNEYGRSRVSSHEVIEKILAMHPGWSRDAVVWRARVLGLTQQRAIPTERWSSTLDHQLLSLMGCQLETIARRLKRSKKSFRQASSRLSLTLA